MPPTSTKPAQGTIQHLTICTSTKSAKTQPKPKPKDHGHINNKSNVHNIPILIKFQLAIQELRCWGVTYSKEQAVCRQLLLSTITVPDRDCFQGRITPGCCHHL
jgi:hypothetical protein